ncbi:MAG: hypothetical protein K0R50_4981 [Eubacterium sp.]|nr:hypothetical protein [Eubacterium sp.]
MEDWAPVVSILGLAVLLVTPYIINKLIKFKLELARINAETTIKAEEIRAKNQLEIEMLLRQEERARRNDYHVDEEYNESPDRIKRRV